MSGEEVLIRTVSKLGFDELRAANSERCGEVFHHITSWSPTDWACAMAGECGEACNFVKKIRRLDSTRAQSTKPDAEYAALVRGLAVELADMVIYADLLAARMEMVGLSEDDEKSLKDTAKESAELSATDAVFQRQTVQPATAAVERCTKVRERFQHEATRSEQDAPLHNVGMSELMRLEIEKHPKPRFDAESGEVLIDEK